MPKDSRSDDVEKLLAEEKKGLIADLLKQREAAINGLDEKLAKLGYQFMCSEGNHLGELVEDDGSGVEPFAGAKKPKAQAMQ